MKIDRLHSAIAREIAKESPEVTERILRGIDIIAARRSG
jgi:hypothetical protein